MSIYISREFVSGFIKGEKELSDNGIVSLLHICANSDDKGWVVNSTVPMLAECAGYDPSQFYRGIRNCIKKGFLQWLGDNFLITNFDKRWKKGGKGAIILPDIILSKRFTGGTKLRTKRIALFLLTLGFADATNKVFRNGKEITKLKLMKISGANCKSELEKYINEIEWLFDFTDKDDSYFIKTNVLYMVRPSVVNKNGFQTLNNLKILLARYKNIKNLGLKYWQDILFLWGRYGGFILHEALEIANKRTDIFDLPAYLHGIIKGIKNLRINGNLELPTVY